MSTKMIRLVKVPVSLYFEIPKDGDTDSFGPDAMNELLREHQRSFSPLSCLLDYALDGDIEALRLEVDEQTGYTEGDFGGAVTVSQWSPWFSNPFVAIKFAADANGTPDDIKRAVEVMVESTGWDAINPQEYFDELLQEIAGVTNIVVQYQDRTYRAAYDV